MKLTPEVFKLANESYLAHAASKLDGIHTDARRILEDLASRGIQGGPTTGMLIKVGTDYIRDRAEQARIELEAACTSFDVDPYPQMLPALTAAIETMVAVESSRVMNQLGQYFNTQPNPAGSMHDCTMAINRAQMESIAIIKTKLEHFVRTRESAQRRTWKSAREKLYWAIGSGLIGVGVTLLGQWFSRLMQVGQHP